MKNLKLTALNLGAHQALTRAEMKNVMGGDGSGSGGSGSGSGGSGSGGSGSGSGPTVSCSGSCQTYTGTLGKPDYRTHFGSCSLKIDRLGPYCQCSASGNILTACPSPS